MTDPITAVAFGAAIGGVAGKVAERAWDVSQAWLQEKFGTHAAETQILAKNNVIAFVTELAARVKELEKRAEFDAAHTLQVQVQPQFSYVFQKVIVNAANTDNLEKHALLADLIAQRLSSDSDSTYAFATEMASDAIVKCTKNQLILLALVSFLDEIRPKNPLAIDEYLFWLARHLSYFQNYAYDEFQAKHLLALNCISYDPTSEKALDFLLALKGSNEFVLKEYSRIMELREVQYINIGWDLGISGIQLTSVGSIVGGLAHAQLTGTKPLTPSWANNELLSNPVDGMIRRLVV